MRAGRFLLEVVVAAECHAVGEMADESQASQCPAAACYRFHSKILLKTNL